MNQKVEQFFEKAEKWKEEYAKLRELIMDCGLNEEYKWMHPCYTLNGKNVVLIHGFKEFCAILFFKGAIMEDPMGLLVQQTENVQSGRQLRFTSSEEIDKKGPVIKQYVIQAINIEKSGKKVELKETKDYEVPEEFQKKLDENSELKKAFTTLSPGRQRAYLFYFATAKQSKTRESRIEKYLDKIMSGKGMDD